MPRLPTLSSSDVIRLLKKKGFVLDRTKGSHHIYYNPGNNHRAIVPVHAKDIPKGTLMEILRQAGLDKEDL